MTASRLWRLGAGALALVALAGCERNLSQARPAEAPVARPAVGMERTGQAAPTPGIPPSPPPFATPPVLPGAADVATLVARVKPSVVNITTERQVKVPRFDFGAPFGLDPFGGLFGPREQDRHGSGDQRPGPDEESFTRRAAGSGFIIDPAGHVVTNAHVVADSDVVRVKLADDRELAAKVVGRDDKLDLAVLRIEGAKDLPAVTLGSSEALQVGEYVVAIGNPFGLGHTVTMGVVSAKSRTIGAGPYDDFIQTDASMNPGNSGGPLFNLRGEVVGINTAINTAGRGIGFAIPIDALKGVLPQLLTKGHVERGRLGVVIQPIDEPLAKALDLDRPRGALVAEVEPGSPAARAGLRAGDVILSVGGTDVPRSHDLPRIVSRHAPGSRVALKVLRNGGELTLDVVLSALDGGAAPGSPPSKAGPTPDLGVTLGDARGGGALVERVRPQSAAVAALEPGDVILEVNRAKVANARDASQRIAAAPKDAPVLLKVRRGDLSLFVAIDRSRPR